MDEQEDSSMGLIIAIIAGGVVLVLVVLAVLGMGMWFLMPGPAFPPPAPVAVAVVAEGPVAEVVAEEPMPVAEKQAIPKEHERLLGNWETTFADGTKAGMSFGADGKLRLTKQPPGADAPDSMALRWVVLEAKGDRLKVRRVSDNKAYQVEQNFEFEGNDRFVIVGPFQENDRWVLKGPGGTTIYRRK